MTGHCLAWQLQLQVKFLLYTTIVLLYNTKFSRTATATILIQLESSTYCQSTSTPVPYWSVVLAVGYTAPQNQFSWRKFFNLSFLTVTVPFVLLKRRLAISSEYSCTHSASPLYTNPSSHLHFRLDQPWLPRKISKTITPCNT